MKQIFFGMTVFLLATASAGFCAEPVQPLTEEEKWKLIENADVRISLHGLESIVFEKPMVAQTPYFSMSDLELWLAKYDQKKELAVITMTKVEEIPADLAKLEELFRKYSFHRIVFFQGINSSGDFPVLRDTIYALEKNVAEKVSEQGVPLAANTIPIEVLGKPLGSAYPDVKELNDLKKCTRDLDCMASCAQLDCFNRPLVNDCLLPRQIECACINNVCHKAQ